MPTRIIKTRLVRTAAVVLAFSSLFMTPANAAVAPDSVSVLTVEGIGTTLTLELDKPMPAAKAEALERKLARDIAAASPEITVQQDQIWDSGTITSIDSNGTHRIYRNASLRQLRWDYRIGYAVQAIIVGTINERGLDYWINGQSQPRNQQHLYIPKDYWMHGTMSGVDRGEHVDYQDYISFRHNVNGGGFGHIAWAGSVDVMS